MKRKVDDDIRQVFERYMRKYPAKVRLQHYVHEAERQQRTETKVAELQLIKGLLKAAQSARQAIDSQDLDHFALAFEHVMRRAIVLKFLDLEAAIKKEQGDYVKELAAEIEELKSRPSRGGLAKAAKNTQIVEAKENALRIWEERQRGKWPELKSDADFYRYIMDSYGAPKNPESVRRWVKK